MVTLGEIVKGVDFSHLDGINGRPSYNINMDLCVGVEGKVIDFNHVKKFCLVKFPSGENWWYYIDDLLPKYISDDKVKALEKYKNVTFNIKDFYRRGDVFVHKIDKLIVYVEY